MCGRYSFAVEDALIKERFGVTVRSAVWKARYNCAPVQDLAVIAQDDPQGLSLYRWGLIPHWANDPSMGSRMINARAEGIHERPSFRKPFRSQRCLVPADAFYEWKRSGTEKIPYRISLTGNRIFSMAGIWDQWISPDGEIVRSFSIITTRPNELVRELHDRMPVILPQKEERTWLGDTPEKLLLDLLVPYPEEEMTAFPVSSLVNNVRNEGPELAVPV